MKCSLPILPSATMRILRKAPTLKGESLSTAIAKSSSRWHLLPFPVDWLVISARENRGEPAPHQLIVRGT